MELELEPFLSSQGTVLDVRTPGEFIQGRIPGAYNHPLFSNEERSVIGTLYKQKGREEAVQKGLEIVGPHMSKLALQAKALAPSGQVKVHCWRGGMRSAAMAWLLNFSGLKAITLKGGYKTFRRWVLSSLDQVSSFDFRVLGGFTGSGKTAILQEMNRKGAQVLDLEKLAHHRGSSFGSLGMSQQPSQELFENEIAMVLKTFKPTQPIWIEDESRLIGMCKIPDLLYQSMRKSPCFLIERPLDERLQILQQEYGSFSCEELITCSQRIQKRLGGLKTQETIELLRKNETQQALNLLLSYYDKAYAKGLESRERAIQVRSNEKMDAEQWAERLLKRSSTL